MYWIVRRRQAVLALAAAVAVLGGAIGVSAYGQQRAASAAAAVGNWGLGFHEAGQPPTGNVSREALKTHNAYFLGDTGQKTIYLTFDCGYENGNTAPILDALQKHHAPAAFFVVGHFLETAPELVQRMVAEGHTVGNHTWHHPDMSAIADRASFEQELQADHGKILPAAPRKIQRKKSGNGVRHGLPHLFLESRLCGLVRRPAAHGTAGI